MTFLEIKKSKINGEFFINVNAVNSVWGTFGDKYFKTVKSAAEYARNSYKTYPIYYGGRLLAY
jgi:hypothetical protein